MYLPGVLESTTCIDILTCKFATIHSHVVAVTPMNLAHTHVMLHLRCTVTSWSTLCTHETHIFLDNHRKIVHCKGICVIWFFSPSYILLQCLLHNFIPMNSPITQCSILYVTLQAKTSLVHTSKIDTLEYHNSS